MCGLIATFSIWGKYTLQKFFDRLIPEMDNTSWKENCTFGHSTYINLIALIPFSLPARKIVTVLIVSSTFVLQGCISENDRTSQRLHDYFESIRNNEALLTAFFSEMPKGGDLHNHFSGSVYTETYWNYLLRKNPWFDTVTLAFEYDSIRKVNKKGDYRRYRSAAALETAGKLADIKQRILQSWSVKDYVDLGIPSHKHFFDTFGKLPSGGWKETGIGLQELQHRAARENVQYLELMLRSVPSDMKTAIIQHCNWMTMLTPFACIHFLIR